MLRDRHRLYLLYAIGLLAFAVPVLVAFRLAHSHAIEEQQEYALNAAGGILDAAHKVSTQVDQAISALERSGVPDPCSPASIENMRKAVVENNLLFDVGYMQNDWLMCSALGRKPHYLGPVSFHSNRGFAVRAGIPHPLSPSSRILVSTHEASGYSALVHHDIALNVRPLGAGIVTALVSVSRQQPLVHHGDMADGWLQRVRTESVAMFYDGQYVVAWMRSNRYDYGALVAIPNDRFAEDSDRALRWILPVSLCAGALLLVVLARLARYQGSLAAAFASGLKRDEFYLVYQPIVDLATGHWVGVEALLRWRRRNGETVGPDIFIPMAERRDMMGLVTAKVIELFERDMADLLRAHPDFYVALNLSAKDLCNPGLPDTLARTIRRMGIAPRNLQVEATESGLLNIDAASSNLHALRDMGCQVAIDDFGTGYSSLAYLTRLPMDALKIDKHFVDTIGTESVTSHVIVHIIEMAKALQLRMVAEGVETLAQADYLRQRGVRYGQGWLFAKPLSPLDLRAGLARQAATAH